MALTFEFQQPVDMTVTGVALWLMPALVNGFRATDRVEVARAPDSAGAPGTWETIARLEPLPSQGRAFIDTRPWTTALWWYRYRHIHADGAVVSAWSTETQHSVGLLPRANEDAVEHKIAMAYRATPFGDDGTYALAAVSEDGFLAPEDVMQSDGIIARVIAKGYLVGEGRNGDAVSYPEVFQNPPMIVMRGGISYEPRSGQWSPSFDSTKPQYDDLIPLNTTASGFTIRARLKQKGATSAQSDDFPTDNVLDAVGESTEANLDPGGAVDDTYTVRYDVSFEVFCPGPGKPNVSGSVTVAVDTNAQDGSGWIERRADTFAHTVISMECTGPETASWNFTAPVVVSGLGLNDDVRVRIKAKSGSAVDIVVHGHDSGDATRGVSYNTATDAYASKTPDTEDSVKWEAMAVN